MLDGLLGRGYASKCKSLMKLTKSRIEAIQRKRNATLKFLKEVMADLLAKGLEIDAYGRAEGLLAEVIMSSCYEYVDKSCDFVLKHLSVMQKIRHCPEDCKEAVSSLMFAAARFSDLPELRDLRDIFLERYGSSVELFANKQFVEHLSSTPITTDKKIRLMREIASEFSIAWDSKGIEQRASKPSPFMQEQPKVHGPSNGNEYRSIRGKDTVLRDNFDVSPRERQEIAYDGHLSQNGKERHGSKRNELNSQSRYEVPNSKYNPLNAEPSLKLRDSHDGFSQSKQEVATAVRDPWKTETPSKRSSSASSSQRKGMEAIGFGSQQSNGTENTAPKRDGPDPLSHGKPDIHSSHAGLWSKADNKDQHHVGQYNVVSSAKDAREETQKSNVYYNNAMPIPPPYTKPNSKLKDVKYEGSVRSPFVGSDGNGDPHENSNARQETNISNPIPKPRSSRRRHSKSRSIQDEVDLPEDSAGVSKRRSKSRRRDDSRRGLQILFDDEHNEKDEEERMIDRLLIHYSKKPSVCEPETIRRKSRSHKVPEISEIVPPPRSISLPREQTAPRETAKAKVFSRAASFQPDGSSAAKHVHPKLPDYDDLAARFAALKGR